MIVGRVLIGIICWLPALAAVLAASYILLHQTSWSSLAGAMGFLTFLGFTSLAGASPNARLALARCLKLLGVVYALAAIIGLIGHHPGLVPVVDASGLHQAPELALVIGATAAVLSPLVGFLISYDHEPAGPSWFARASLPALARATGGAISDRRLQARNRLDENYTDGTGRFDESLPHLNGFNDYYNRELRGKLGGLELTRSQTIRRRNIKLAVWIPILTVLSVLAVDKIEEDSIWQGIVGFVLLVAWLVGIGDAIGDRRKIRRDVKTLLIEGLSTFFDLEYGTTNASLDMKAFQDVGLIETAQSWVAEETLTGRRDDIEMIMSEVEVYDLQPGHRRSRRAVKFRGAALQFTIHKQFQGRTVGLSDRGLAANLIHRISGGRPRIRLEDREFEDLFEIYADDEIEARYLLTPAFMERMVRLSELIGRGRAVRFAFANNRFLLAVEGWDLFEAAKLSHAVDDPVQVQTFINEVGMILDVAATLKLMVPTRI